MSSSPELRVGDADRDRVARDLRDHLVAGRLTLDEFVERVEAAHEARTVADLEQLTHDLPAVSIEAAPAVPAPSRKRARWIVAVMSGVERRRRWRLAQKTNVVALMGGANLDLRQAELEAAESTLSIYAMMGGVNVILPEGVRVDVTGLAIMGSKNERISETAPVRDAPLVRIRVLAIMGGVNIRSRPGGAAYRPPELPRPS